MVKISFENLRFKTSLNDGNHHDQSFTIIMVAESFGEICPGKPPLMSKIVSPWFEKCSDKPTNASTLTEYQILLQYSEA